MPWVNTPNERVPHRPEGCCGCGADLAVAHDVGIARSHQVHDLPEVRIKVSQHDVYGVRCACGAEYVGSLPAEVSSAPSSYGVNLKTLTVYLLVYQHVPVAGASS
jgi:transposase